MHWLPIFLLACGPSTPTVNADAPTAASGEEAPDMAPRTRIDIDIPEFASRHAAGPPIFDVRTTEEYNSGHIPGAVHLPLDQVTADHPALTPLDKTQPVYLVCAVGGRSAMAADRLASAGFHAVNVQGGTNGWKAAGHPVE